jgi:two-component system, OmpR family, sensor kinase
MLVRNGPSLRWRITILTALAIALLSLITAVISYLVSESSLRSDLQADLRADALRIAERYSGQPFIEVPRNAPTGGIFVQLYDQKGLLFTANNSEYEPTPSGDTAVPPEKILALLGSGEPLKDWQGELAGRPVQMAIASVGWAAVAVFVPTEYIREASNNLARSLLLTAIGVTVLSGLIAYLLSRASMLPITQLATRAAQLNPEKLTPIEYHGPNDEVGQLTNVLNNLIVRLRSSMDAQRSFLAETSHELRTPLTSLQGFLERATRRHDAGQNITRDLDDAKRISQTMSRLVADLLQLSRGELVQELVPHLVDPYLDILQPVAEEFPGVRLSGEEGETLVGDPERLKQLVRNLVANAVRATGDATKVEVRLRSEKDAVHLEVVDSGPGIPEDMLPHIFDKFYKGAAGGAGLGLTIAKQIAEVHKGTLTVESEVSVGTTFRLILPLLAAEDEMVTNSMIKAR